MGGEGPHCSDDAASADHACGAPDQQAASATTVSEIQCRQRGKAVHSVVHSLEGILLQRQGSKDARSEVHQGIHSRQLLQHLKGDSNHQELFGPSSRQFSPAHLVLAAVLPALKDVLQLLLCIPLLPQLE